MKGDQKTSSYGKGVIYRTHVVMYQVVYDVAAELSISSFIAIPKRVPIKKYAPYQTHPRLPNVSNNKIIAFPGDYYSSTVPYRARHAEMDTDQHHLIVISMALCRDRETSTLCMYLGNATLFVPY